MKPSVVAIEVDGRVRKYVRWSTASGWYLRYCGLATRAESRRKVRAALREARESQAEDLRLGRVRRTGLTPDEVLHPEREESVFVPC